MEQYAVSPERKARLLALLAMAWDGQAFPIAAAPSDVAVSPQLHLVARQAQEQDVHQPPPLPNHGGGRLARRRRSVCGSCNLLPLFLGME